MLRTLHLGSPFIDREEGARANIEGAGLKFEALFTTSDLGVKKE